MAISRIVIGQNINKQKPYPRRLFTFPKKSNFLHLYIYTPTQQSYRLLNDRSVNLYFSTLIFCGCQDNTAIFCQILSNLNEDFLSSNPWMSCIIKKT